MLFEIFSLRMNFVSFILHHEHVSFILGQRPSQSFMFYEFKCALFCFRNLSNPCQPKKLRYRD